MLLAAVLHALWNSLAKAIDDQLVGFMLIDVTGIAVCLAAIPVVAAPAPSSWPFIAASACLHVGYKLVLMRSYRLGDLSQVYPLARGVAPLLVAGFAAALRPTWRKGAASGVLSLAAYGLVLWAQTRGALAAVAALRETSVIIAAAIGTAVLGERFGRRRVLAATLVACGIVLLNLS